MHSFQLLHKLPRLLGSFLFLGIVVTSAAWAQQPMLIPQPQELQVRPDAFKVTTDLKIVTLAIGADEGQYAAESLAEELRAVTGRDYPRVSAVPATTADPIIVLGKLDQPAMKQLLDAQRLDASAIGEQGYVLDVAPHQVLVAGNDAAGLFYGVQTLKQLLTGDAQSAEILGARIRDRPALRYRGTQVNLGPGGWPKLEYLKRIVRTVAEFKLNQLYVNIGDSFPLSGQPLLGVLSETFRPEDWRDLVGFAAHYHVDIVPQQNFCHHHNILRFEEYANLAETPHGSMMLSLQPAGYDYTRKMVEQMIPVFQSKFYNVGCDETYELGHGKSHGTVGQLYTENLLRIYAILHKYNKQVIFWGDIMLKLKDRTDLLKTLPKDMIVDTWEYDKLPSYEPSLKPFVDAGMKVIVSPEEQGGGLVTDYEYAAYNIGHFVDEGKKSGAIGMNNTTWKDNGGEIYGLNWWSIVYGAAASWEPGIPAIDAFDKKYDWAFYRNTDHRFAEAIRQLGHVSETLCQALVKVGGDDDCEAGEELFWHDPFSARGQADARNLLPVAPQIRLAAEGAYTVFANSASRALRNADTLPDLEWAALRVDALGMRYIYLEEMAIAYANALQGVDNAPSDEPKNSRRATLLWLRKPPVRLADLRDYTTRLRELYAELWQSENLPNWLPNELQLYDSQSRMWQDKIVQFQRIVDDFGQTTTGQQEKPLPPAEDLGLMNVTATR